MMKNKLLLASLVLAVPLAGCISFGAKPPPQLLTLYPAVQVPVGQVQSSSDAPTMTVLIPTVPHELANTRVPVHQGETAIAYVKDAQWVEAPPRLFARLVGDTIGAQTGKVILSYRQSQLDPGSVLSGELRQFGIYELTPGAGEAVVTYDAVLTRGEAAVFEKRRFQARVPLAPIDASTVGPALSQAANQVAAEVADWVGK